MLRDTLISRGFNWRGAWTDGTSYVANDLVEHNGSTYIATNNHTASPVTEPGVGANWDTVWDLFVEKGDTGTPSPFDNCDKLFLEMEMEFKTAYLCYYKELTYNAQKQLTDVDIYSDSTANLLLFHKDLTYNATKQLIQTDLTRISDGVVLTTVFTYNAQKQLVNTERSGYCSCP